MKKNRSNEIQLDTKRIASFVKWYKRMTVTQRTGLAFLALTLMALPLGVLTAQQQVKTGSKAYRPTSLPPRISSSYLPPAVVGKQYLHSLDVIDPDSNAQELTLTTSGLPTGISLGTCTSPSDNANMLRCELSGKPIKAGTYSVLVTVTDKDNAPISKSVELIVEK